MRKQIRKGRESAPACKLASITEVAFPSPPLGVHAGAPAVEIWLKNWPVAQVMDLTPPIVPELGLGRSPPAKTRKVGAALPEAGPERTRWAFWFANVAVNVPETVTGEPETVNMPGIARPTLVTVPVPVLHEPQTGSVPFEVRHSPLLPIPKRAFEPVW